MHSEPFGSLSEQDQLPTPAVSGCPAPAANEPTGRSHRFNEAAVATAAKLLPLVKLLETIQPQVANDSIFHTKRVKIQEEMTRAYGELLAEKPRHKALLHAFKTLSELVREEAHDLSKDELKQAARELVLATLKNAPQLISAAHQARLLA
jgi:hypothetical protein